MKKSLKKLKLPIKPFKLKGKIIKIPISKIKSGKKPTIEIKKAIVVYVDVLGFSKKTNVKDIENTLLDFAGSLATIADTFQKIRFNVFSDNAFLATSQSNARDLISALRYSFQRWCSNGILVRGGIAIGDYREFSSVAIASTPSNFIGNHFAGSAVIEAVKLEANPHGAFIFTNKKCANFLAKNFGEPVFVFDNSSMIIGWSDEDSALFQFTAISFFRLLRVISQKNNKLNSIKTKLIKNILYAKLQATKYYIPVVFLSILSLPSINPRIKNKACAILKIKDPDDFEFYDELIKIFLAKNMQELEILKAIVKNDSSIPHK